MDTRSFGRRVAAASVGVLAVGVIELPTAHAALSYGSIAYADNGAGAVVWNYPSSRDAQQAAIQYCGWTSCEALNYFTDCGVAVRNDTHVQAAHGRTLGAATRAALNAIPGGGGYIDLWACN
ncbi:DUF4189 domain-containing protein [Mycobacterium sp. URHD0025]|uniref:DUF4189 domain-containing protein n=1 Tax=Mycobacterium sp. URHD0025 TaxID=1298864 RepID=UPI00068639DC|nr:DUF4189 domain-containing protein [Mycobacterium sp. URHD0025]